MRKFCLIFLIFYALYGQAQPLSPPQFSVQGGFFEQPFFLMLTPTNSTDTIFYTIDGSDPTRNSLAFADSIQIINRTTEPNLLSNYPTNFITSGENAYGPPSVNLFKGTVIKARSFNGNNVPSDVITHSYFVDASILQMFDIPVVSLSTDAENLFSDTSGIFVPGVNYVIGDDETGNYFQEGAAWQRQVTLEYFSSDGQKLFESRAGIRINGGDTRKLPQKTLRLYADSVFAFKFFPEKNVSSFKTLLLRNSGNDFKRTMFRDAFMSSLIGKINPVMEYLASQPVVLFINGEYWGIHNLRERPDKYFLESNTGFDAGDIDLLKEHGLVEDGDNIHYFQWYSFLDAADMTLASSLDYMSEMIDVRNFTDYNIAQVYFANIDWPGNNRAFWRPQIQGGAWRWIVYDTDFGFGLESYNSFTHPTLDFVTTPNGPTSPPSWNTNPPYATLQLRKMLQNEVFRNNFVNRTADLLNTLFAPSSIVSIIDSFQTVYNNEMSSHIDRWSHPSSINDWDSYVQSLRDFAYGRPANLRTQFLNYFNESETLSFDIEDKSFVTLNVSDANMGTVKISTVEPNIYPWTGIYFNGIPIILEAKPKLGFRFVKWQGTNITDSLLTINIASDTLFEAVFELDTTFVYRTFYINELMAANTSTVEDEFGEYDDWIELYNPYNDTVDIGGYYISDDLSAPFKHRIPFNANTKIPPGGFLLIWADATPTQGSLHLNFKLTATGEGVYICDSTGLKIDSITFGNQPANISYGRFPDAYSHWQQFADPTPGASNVLTFMTGNSSQIRNYIIFPNPCSSGTLFIDPKPQNVEIYTLTGRKVIAESNTALININNLKKGFYIILINNSYRLKFVVQ